MTAPRHVIKKAWTAVHEALHNLERPFYSACAGGPHFEQTPEWLSARASLRYAEERLRRCSSKSRRSLS